LTDLTGQQLASPMSEHRIIIRDTGFFELDILRNA
jgi:hypothetical protein